MSTPILIKDSFQLTGDNIYTRNHSYSFREQKKFVRGELFEKLDDGYGNPMLKKIASNTVVVGGAILALRKLVNPSVSVTWVPNTIDSAYGLTGSSESTPLNNNPVICLFGCGISGAGLQFGDVQDTSIKQKDIKGNLIPLRYISTAGGEGKPTGDDAEKYFFKSTYIPDSNGGNVHSGSGYTAYYLKEFTDAPVIKSYWKDATDSDMDGTEITQDISGDTDHNEGIETFVEFTLDLNTNDVREWFEANGNVQQARYNSFGFYTGVKGSGNEYHNVRLFSTVHFNNRDVSVRTTSSFVYRIYSLI